MREFVLFSIAILSVISFTESTKVLPFTEEESERAQNLNGEDEIEAKANCRRKLELVLDPQRRRPVLLGTFNFAQLDIKKVTERGKDVDLGKRVDRLMGERPEFRNSCSCRCVDTITRAREELAVSKREVVNVLKCKGGVAETCRRRYPECFKGGCDVEMLTKRGEVDRCFQVCRGDVPAPRCTKILCDSKMSSQDVIDDSADVLTTSNKDLLLDGIVHRGLPRIRRSSPSFHLSNSMFKSWYWAPYLYPLTYYLSGAPRPRVSLFVTIVVLLLLVVAIVCYFLCYILCNFCCNDDKAETENQEETLTEYV